MRPLSALPLILLAFSYLPSGGVVGEEPQVKVVTTIPDIALIVREIGGGRVDVKSVMPPGADPHSFSLTPKDRELLERADLIVLANSGLLHMEESIKESFGEKEILDFPDYGATLHDFPSCSECPHGYWLYFDNTLAIARAVRDSLSELDPEGAAHYTANYEEFEGRVERARGDILETSRGLGLYGKSVVTAVPGVNYIVLNAGMKVGATLLKEGSGFLSGAELAQIEKGLKDGRYLGVVCPESMKEAKAGELSRQISKDTGAPTAYVKFIVSEESSDPISLQYYNLASLKGLLSSSSSEGFSWSFLLTVIISLAVLAAGEAYVIYRMRVSA